MGADPARPDGVDGPALAETFGPTLTMPPMAIAEPGTPARTTSEPPGAPAFALALCLVLASTIVSLVSGGPADADYQRRWVLFASDVGLAGVLATQLIAFRGRRIDWSKHRCAMAALGLALSLLPAFAAHPSARGVAGLLRWVAVAVVAFGVGRIYGPARSFVVGAFAGVTAFQVVVALAERAVDGPVGLGSIGEPSAYEIGGRYASTGVTAHPYVFAAWCTLAAAVLLAAVTRTDRPSRPLVGAVLVPLVGVGLTMSRAGALAVAMVLASFAVAALKRPPLRVVLVAAVAATALGVALNMSGWADRAGGTVKATSASAMTSSRTELLRQANGLFRQDPILGVGPGRYVEALEQRPDLVKLATQQPSRPVHLVPYLVVVEGGLLVLPALLLLAWMVIAQSWRAGPAGVGLTLSVLPFLALDHLHWSLPQGLLLTAIWLGALDHLASRPRRLAS